MATTPHPPRTRLQKHQAAVLKADDELAAAKADLQTRCAAFGQDVMAEPDHPPSLETAEIKASELLDAADTPAEIKDKCKAFLGDALRLREAVARASGRCEMARENPPTPDKNVQDPTHTPGSASTVARRVSFFGREMMLDAPAESTPNTPALLKQIRESGVSPMLTLLTDQQLKDPGIAADAVRSLTPAALATVGLRNADGERGRQKRRRETDPAPRGTGALPPPPARKYAAKAEDIDTFSDDEEDDEEHDPSDEPFVVKQTTFPLLQLASSMKLNMEPVVAGYAWSNALCAVTAGLSVDSDRNRDYSLLVDYSALRPLANPLHAPARALLIHLYEAWALEKAARRNKGDTLDEWVSGAQEDRRRENLAEAIKSLSGSAQATTSSTRFRRLLSTASTSLRHSSLPPATRMAYKDPIDDKLELVTRLDEQLRDGWPVPPEVRCAHP
ncbi:hypothetical protein RI054_27g112730 [Pseudoscourfieldia marina]